MMAGLFSLAQKGLLTLDPECAHELSLRALEAGLYPPQTTPDDARLKLTLWGLDFPNPIGMAAGYDKDARVPGALLKMGFGFVEVGTVTPRPQTGNPRPRVFRLIRDRAVINRLGFNSAGHDTVHERLFRRNYRGIVGVNIGANKDSGDFIADYEAGLRAFADCADYFTVNISSPNTPGLRDLQAPERLAELLSRLTRVRAELPGRPGKPVPPLLVKLSPDIHHSDLPPIVETLVAHGVDGIILTNTTLARDGITQGAHSAELGGLSGKPLFARATRLLAKVYMLTQGAIPLIGVGGIDSGETALAKIQAGASLLQIYTGLVYEGPALLPKIKEKLVRHMEAAGVTSLSEIVGTQAQAWANLD